jgi:hypothetical protein
MIPAGMGERVDTSVRFQLSMLLLSGIETAPDASGANHFLCRNALKEEQFPLKISWLHDDVFNYMLR